MSRANRGRTVVKKSPNWIVTSFIQDSVELLLLHRYTAVTFS